MGEVYRAHDARLKRDVAIKRLPEAFSHDADRVLRFQREAETLARVNHPNIGGIYDLLEVDGARFLVLEFVDGQTLADRLQDGPIAPAQALRIARQICEALEAAHGQGVVHRDLKPANVALSSDDTVKVLDFGLAKSIHHSSPLVSGEVPPADLSRSPTVMASVVRTDVGTIMGTAAYMSPEQARGGPIDARTDVFSFGCVLYEMLAGCRAFPGDTVSDVIAAILRGEPDLARLPRRLDARVRVLLIRALAKAPRDRWQATGDLRYEIEQIIAHPSAPLPGESPGRRGSSLLAWGLASAFAASTLVAGLLWLTGRSTDTSNPQPPLQLSFEPPEGMEFDGLGFALSADGSRIAFAAKNASGETSLYVRSVHEAASRRIEGTSGGTYLFWSPDGRWLGYFDDQKLKKISIDGGAPQVLADAPRPGAGTWNHDGVILFSGNGDSITKLAADGVSTPLPQTAGLAAMAPSFLDDGVHFIRPGRRAALDPLAGRAGLRWLSAVRGRRTAARAALQPPGTPFRGAADTDRPRHRVWQQRLCVAVGGDWECDSRIRSR
jgi:serine/threonine protein kinase